MHALRLSFLLLSLGCALACGARSIGSDDFESGGSGAGGSGAGGSGNVTPSGKAGSAGTPPTGGGCACDPIACGPDYIAVQNPDGCCSSCELDLKACAERQRTYVDYRAKLVQENVDRGCSVNEDCVLFDDLTGCSPTCTFSIPRASRRGIDDRLYSFADETCNRDCPQPPIPPCDPRPSAVCVMGRCL